MLLSQGTILPDFYFFSFFLQKKLLTLKWPFYYAAMARAPRRPRLSAIFLLSSTPTIDTEPFIPRFCYAFFAERRKHRAKTVRCFPLLSAFGSSFGSNTFAAWLAYLCSSSPHEQDTTQTPCYAQPHFPVCSGAGEGVIFAALSQNTVTRVLPPLVQV